MKFFDFSQLVRNLFRKHLKYVEEHYQEFSLSKTDFTRIRKCPLRKLLRAIFLMTRGNLPDALFESLLPEEKGGSFSLSAFIQQRNKLLLKAFPYIFHHVTEDLLSIISPKTYHGYSLLACDGSDFPMPTPDKPDKKDESSQKKVQHRMLHVNALYDVLNHLYVAVTTEPKDTCRERDELLRLVEALAMGGQGYRLAKTIIICDRGYESYHVLVRLIRSGARFVIRAQKQDGNGILSGLTLPSAEDGRTLDVTLPVMVRKDSHGIYRHSHASTMDPARDERISLRIVSKRLKDGSFEYLLTNLPREEFSKRQIANIYRKRWEIETSFRYLKYGIGGLVFHARKREHQKMELYASLTLYNCISTLVNFIRVPRDDTTYRYKVDFTSAVKKCIYFLMVTEVENFDLEGWLKLYRVPIRTHRTYPRKSKIRECRGFHNRT